MDAPAPSHPMIASINDEEHRYELRLRSIRLSRSLPYAPAGGALSNVLHVEGIPDY